MAVAIRLALVVCAVLLGGCGTLLPSADAEDVSSFHNYEQAREALERIEPYRSTLADLRTLGFDVQASAANVQRVPYPQWVGLLVQPNVPLEQFDPGIRDCVAAREACRVYQFHFGRVERERRGGFMADFLNFRRVTRTYGWRFEGLVLVRDDIVLFRNHGGQPRIEAVEDRKNPLGPLQSIGESVGASLRP